MLLGVNGHANSNSFSRCIFDKLVARHIFLRVHVGLAVGNKLFVTPLLYVHNGDI